MLKIAFIGDIVGRPGRRIIEQNLKKIKEKYQIDFVIANGENASHGFGLTPKNANELFSAGIDLITGGNHSFDKKKEMIALLTTKELIGNKYETINKKIKNYNLNLTIKQNKIYHTDLIKLHNSYLHSNFLAIRESKNLNLER